MAKGGNSVTHGTSGRIGKNIVFKTYKDKTVITAFPDMSKVKTTPAQKERRKIFAKAVVYAQSILRNPELKAEYAKKWRKRGRTIYHALIREYLQSIKNNK